MTLQIELLADHPEHVYTLARWHCEDEGRPGDPAQLEFWCRHLRYESGRERVPIAFIALDGDSPVGGIALVERNMDSHPDLSPWLAGTYVHPSRRGEGIRQALVEHASPPRATSA